MYGVLMKVQCPHCTHSYEIDGSKLPETGAKVKCTRCETVFDIIPTELPLKLFVQTDEHTWFEAGSMDEIKEWIRENRLLRKHRLSNDQQSWKQLDEIDELKVIFDQVSPKEMINQVPEKAVEKVVEKPVEKSTVELNDNPFMMKGDQPKIDSMKKIDYADYEDSVIESMELPNPGTRRKTGLILSIIIMIAGVSFVFLKPDLTKKIIKQITASDQQTDDHYNQGFSLLKKYDLVPLKKSVKIFQEIQKGKKDHYYALSGEVSAHFMIYSYLAGELEIKQLILKQLEKDDSIKISQSIEELKKRIESIKKEQKTIVDTLGKMKRGVEMASKKGSYHIQFALGYIAIIEKNETELKEVIKGFKRGAEKRSEVDLLNTYLTPIDGEKIKAISRKHFGFIPLQYRRVITLFNAGNYPLSVAMMETILAVNPKNKYILALLTLTEEMIPHFIPGAVEPTVKKENDSDNVVSEKNDIKKENITKPDAKEVKKDTVKTNESKKEIKEATKPVQKPVKPVKPVKKEPEVALSFDELIKRADRAFDRERKGTAYKLYKKAARMQRSAKAAAQMGWILFDWGKNSSAIAYFKRSIGINHNYIDAYLGLGEVYMADENKEQARKYLKLLIQKGPNSQEARIAKNYLKKLK